MSTTNTKQRSNLYRLQTEIISGISATTRETKKYLSYPASVASHHTRSVTTFDNSTAAEMAYGFGVMTKMPCLPHNVPGRVVRMPEYARQSLHVETAPQPTAWRDQNQAGQRTCRQGIASAAAVAVMMTCQPRTTGLADCCLPHWYRHHHHPSWTFVNNSYD